MSVNKTISAEVLKVLHSAVLEGNVVRLGGERMERGLYEAVNEVLENAGGKWKGGKTQGHVFKAGFDKLNLAMRDGVTVDEQQKFQAFFTPGWLCEKLCVAAEVQHKTVLEPSAGTGMIATTLRAFNAAEIHCVEINPEAAAVLSEAGFKPTIADFMVLPPEPRFDRVVMNPPFTKNQDVLHVRQALKWLKPEGVLVAIMAGNTSRAPFEKLLAEFPSHSIEEVEAGAFKESGTMVATIILKITLGACASSAKSKRKEIVPYVEVECESPESVLADVRKHTLEILEQIDALSADLASGRTQEEVGA